MDDVSELNSGPQDYGPGTAADLRRTADVLDDLWRLLNHFNDKGSPRKNDAAGWREDFMELWDGLNKALDASEGWRE